jgi:orotidine-5'-phosphate decarboxylase
LARLGVGIFLDLKFHDIPNTVAASVAAVADLSGVRLVNVHALGGIEMMRAAAKALGRRRSLKLLAVTILTSHNAASLRCIGVLGRPETRALKLAGLARQAGLDGVVASAHEVAAIKRACGRKFLVVVPGVRPSFAREKKDQARVATPAAALRAGADYIVVGRPITTARHPLVATRALLAEIKNAN